MPPAPAVLAPRIRPPGVHGLPRSLKALRAAAASTTTAVVVLWAVLPGSERLAGSEWATFELGALVLLLAVSVLAAGERLELQLTWLGRAWSLRGADAALPLVLWAAPVPWATGAAVLAAALAGSRAAASTSARTAMAGGTSKAGRRGRWWWNGVEFDVLSALTAAAAAGCVVLLSSPLTGRLVAAVLGGVAGAVVRQTASAAAVAATARRSLAGLLRPRLAPAVLQSLVAGPFGVLAAWLARYEPVGLVGLLLPAALVLAAREIERQRAAEARLYASLAAEQQRLRGRSSDEFAGVLLVIAARLLGGADVELLLAGPEGLVRYLGDESGVLSREVTSGEALDAPHLRGLLSGDGVATWLSGAGGEPAIGFAVGMRGSLSAPFAVVVARRPARAAAFGKQDARVARVLAVQAGSWLLAQDRENSDLESPAGENAAPTRGSTSTGGHDSRRTRQFIVREAAARLTAAAQARELDPERMAEELRLVQRAVAALVGERRRGREGARHVPRQAQAGDEDGSQQARRGTDWTTTGVLPAAGPDGLPHPPQSPVPMTPAAAS